MTPTLGVLITYHNEKELLSRCLNSLLKNGLFPDEILVHDDASDFPAQDYIPEKFKDRVVVIRSAENLGPAKSRNVLLRQSRCDFIHFHDADDLFHPLWLERMRQELGDQKIEAIFCQIIACGDGDHRIERPIKFTPGIDPVNFTILYGLMTPSIVFLRKKALDIEGYRSGTEGAEDYDFFIRLLLTISNYKLIDEPLIIQWIRPGSYSKNVERAWGNAIKAIRMLSREIPCRYLPDLADAAVRAANLLYLADEFKQADIAFALAKELGPHKRFINESAGYRLMGSLLGAKNIAVLSRFYRRLIPLNLRRSIRKTFR